MRNFAFLVFFLFSFYGYCNGQTFRDTVGEFVFDSLKHDLGKIKLEDNPRYIIKYFKYIGKDTAKITKAYTSDPHYICKWPVEDLLPGMVYSYTICISPQRYIGLWNKHMGFVFSDGTTMMIDLRGEYIE